MWSSLSYMNGYTPFSIEINIAIIQMLVNVFICTAIKVTVLTGQTHKQTKMAHFGMFTFLFKRRMRYNALCMAKKLELLTHVLADKFVLRCIGTNIPPLLRNFATSLKH
jgi:hypothetical protein